jgi:hypothetical protein
MAVTTLLNPPPTPEEVATDPDCWPVPDWDSHIASSTELLLEIWRCFLARDGAVSSFAASAENAPV